MVDNMDTISMIINRAILVDKTNLQEKVIRKVIKDIENSSKKMKEIVDILYTAMVR